jgi:hypothetical protein
MVKPIQTRTEKKPTIIEEYMVFYLNMKHDENQ